METQFDFNDLSFGQIIDEIQIWYFISSWDNSTSDYSDDKLTLQSEIFMNISGNTKSDENRGNYRNTGNVTISSIIVPGYGEVKYGDDGENPEFDQNVLRPSSGTRAPPGGWPLPLQWEQLTPGEMDDGLGDWEIIGIWAHDTPYNLFLRIESSALNPIPDLGTTFDFYFNVSSTKWYKVQMFRVNYTAWEFNLNYTTVSSGTPDDSNSWTVEESHKNIQDDAFDGKSIGFDYNNDTLDSILFWVSKRNLSQGFDSLGKPNYCKVYADSHDINPTLAAQMDRAPDNNNITYNCKNGTIPEFDVVLLPVPVTMMFLLYIATVKRKKRKKNDQ